MPNAADIQAALRLKHAEDVYVSECKDGQSYNGHSRLDGWAMAKSWAHPRVVGYEIKVSRSDFLNDKKWPAYLPMCNELYFVAPKGLIQVEELSAEVGLLEVVGSCRLVTRKKSAYRDITITEDVFRYILMCRAKIREDEDDVRFKHKVRGDTIQHWKLWLAQKAESRELGYKISRAVRDHVDKVERENRALMERIETYEEVKQVIQKLGLNTRLSTWNVEQRIKAVQSVVPETLKTALDDARSSLASALQQIKNIEYQYEQEAAAQRQPSEVKA